jgi:16S rRNA (guanine527-N7)-methyltransferase
LYSSSSENDKPLDDTNSDSVVVIDEDEWNADINMIDPYSDQAFFDLTNFYTHHNINNSKNSNAGAGAGAIDVKLAYKKLLRLTEEVIGWNERLNLISRKDCTPTVVYHRHVLPSIALLPLILDEINTHHTNNNNNNNDDSNNNDADNTTPIFNIMDVGTGGGFPGLPLALLLPSVQFTLVDSIRKKLLAVSDMASELDVANVRIHHGRVEEMYINEETGQTNMEHYNKYNIILGRSVTALPRFCGWVTNLIQREPPSHQEGGSGGGRLIYIIGGELDEIVSSRIVQDIPIDKLLCRTKVMSDKRALLFNAQDVYEIARNSGEEIVRNDVVVVRNNSSSRRKSVEQSNTTGGGATGKSKPLAKGAWSKKQNDVKKQRGYDDFKRYES